MPDVDPFDDRRFTDALGVDHVAAHAQTPRSERHGDRRVASKNRGSVMMRSFFCPAKLLTADCKLLI